VPEELSKLLGGEIFPLHRLDKAVGGVMIYARTKAAAAAFSRLIQEDKLVKEYVALVHGAVPENGDWQDLLFKDSRKNKVFVVNRQRNGVKDARLEFVRLREGDPTLVRVRLHTGRTHQIRVQFSSRGFPLVGDRKYGAKDEYTAPMLYSCCLTFPYHGDTVTYCHFPDWAQ
jgi:23S rRNA pseudouridine1911/1915/1917 synthase